jgi:hypothetical protein
MLMLPHSANVPGNPYQTRSEIQTSARRAGRTHPVTACGETAFAATGAVRIAALMIFSVRMII